MKNESKKINQREYQHLFGPLISRRLGKSLGVDIIPYKTCNLNCVYCECSLTTDLTNSRKEYVSESIIKEELSRYLTTNPDLDYITFSGSGEPTLNSKIFAISQFIKENFPHYKLCLITNSCTLVDEKFFAEICEKEKLFDLIMPSLDAVTQKVFEKINQPKKGLEITKITEKLIAFSQKFSGEFWLEIFIIPEINDTESELQKFAEILKKIKTTKIMLNCLDRPAPYAWVKAPTVEQMLKIFNFFSTQNIITEIIGKIPALPPQERHAHNLKMKK